MSNTLITKEYILPEINKGHVLRYMKTLTCGSNIDMLIDECISECISVMKYIVCYTVIDIKTEKNKVYFGNIIVESASLYENLSDCDSAVIFGATIGVGIDRLINKYSRLSQVKALCLQAIGAERIEALCDAINNEINNKYTYTKRRFSPGYGDLDLSFQKEIFSLLDLPRKIGLTLNSSLIMSPSKSVTAIIGCKSED